MGIDPMLIDQILLWPSFCCPFSIRMVDWAGWPQQPQQSATMRSAGGSVVAVAATVPTNDEVVFLFFCWCQLLAFYARAHTYTNAEMHGSSKANRKKRMSYVAARPISLSIYSNPLYLYNLFIFTVCFFYAQFLLLYFIMLNNTNTHVGCMAVWLMMVCHTFLQNIIIFTQRAVWCLLLHSRRRSMINNCKRYTYGKAEEKKTIYIWIK